MQLRSTLVRYFLLLLPCISWGANKWQIADLHNHMFAEHAWGSGWFHGHVEGPEHEALSPCSGNPSLAGDHATALYFSFITNWIFKSPDTGMNHGSHGYPDYVTWPRWDTMAHHQMWEGHLKQAWADGLRLQVVSFYNNEVLCALMSNKKFNDCLDMTAVDKQMNALLKFVAGHDQNNPQLAKRSTWVELATSASHAKQIMQDGKLALIASIEVSNLFPEERGPWMKQLDDLYKKGLRSLQLVHQFNGKFAGAALHDPILKAGQVVVNKERFDEKDGVNTRGLSAEGKLLIAEMMKRGMLIDLAHASNATIYDVQKIAQQDGRYYPVYISHSHIKATMVMPRLAYERSRTDDILLYLKNSGGMHGLRTGPDSTTAFEDGKHVSNDCAGTTKSFAQSYLYLDKKLQVPMGLGSDLNGFIMQIKPRFIKQADGNLKPICENDKVAPLNRPFDVTGYGHIGQIGDILRDLENHGVDTKNLAQSAQTFLRMWERAEDASKRLPVIPSL